MFCALWYQLIKKIIGLTLLDSTHFLGNLTRNSSFVET